MVSSQTDDEKAEIEREKQELEEMPDQQLQRLAEIYEKRGLKKETAQLVAKEITANDAAASDESHRRQRDIAIGRSQRIVGMVKNK